MTVARRRAPTLIKFADYDIDEGTSKLEMKPKASRRCRNRRSATYRLLTTCVLVAWFCGLLVLAGVQVQAQSSVALVLALRNATRFFPLMRSSFLPRLYRFVCVPMSTQPFMLCIRRTAVS